MTSEVERLADRLSDSLEERRGARTSDEGADAVDRLVDRARMVKTLEDVPPPPEGLRPGRRAFIEAGVEASRDHRGDGLRVLRIPLVRGGAVAAAAVVVLAVGVALLIGARHTTAVASSLPGDPLYRVKRVGDAARLAMAVGPRAERLQAEVRSERIEEARALLAMGREERVDLRGVLRRGPDGIWRVDGIELAGIEDPPPAVGSRVAVTGATGADGRLHVRQLRVLGLPSPAVSDVGTPTPTRVARRQPAVASDPPDRLTQVPSPTVVSTDEPTVVIVPATPTALVSPTATVTDAPPPRDGSGAVDRPRPERVQFQGVLEVADGPIWRVSGQRVRIGDGEIDTSRGPARVGARVSVEAERRDGQLWLIRLVVLEVEAGAEVVEWRGEIQELAEDRWMVGGIRVLITEDTTIRGEPAVGRTATVRATRWPDGRHIAEEIVVDPLEEVVEFVGRITAVHADRWRVDDRVVWRDPDTEVIGVPAVGDRVAVRAAVADDGRLIARRLEVIATPTPSPTAASISPTPGASATPTAERTATPTAPPAAPSPSATAPSVPVLPTAEDGL